MLTFGLGAAIVALLVVVALLLAEVKAAKEEAVTERDAADAAARARDVAQQALDDAKRRENKLAADWLARLQELEQDLAKCQDPAVIRERLSRLLGGIS